MISVLERTPSRNGIGSGLHIGHRPVQPTPVQPTNDNVGTQRPNTPAPSHRGYA